MGNPKIVLDIYIGITILFSILTAAGADSPLMSPLRWIIISWSFLYYMKAVINFRNESFYIKSLIILFILFFIYGLAIIYEGQHFVVGIRNQTDVSNKAYLFKVSTSLLPIFVYYNFGKTGQLNKTYINQRALLLMSVATLCYMFYAQQQSIKQGSDEVTNNAGYVILSIIPMLMLLKFRSWKQYLLLGFCMMLILLAVKRGAILISAILMVLYFGYFLKMSNKKTIRANIILIIFFTLVGVIALSVLLENNSYINQRFNDTLQGETSNRDEIYGTIFDFIIVDISIKNILFGYGANGTLELFGWYAHNDWLEIAINQGLLGIGIYMVYWVAFLLLCMKKNMPTDIRLTLWMLFVIYFLKTIFSMSYDQYTLYAGMALGYCVACTIPKKLKKQHKVTKRIPYK